MDRRTFLAGTGAVLLAAPLAAEAQQAGRMYRIGYLFEGAPADQASPPSPQLRALEETLRELGYVKGRNLVVERRTRASPSPPWQPCCSGMSPNRASAVWNDHRFLICPRRAWSPDTRATQPERHAL
jgi:hypothetical protein